MAAFLLALTSYLDGEARHDKLNIQDQGWLKKNVAGVVCEHENKDLIHSVIPSLTS